MPFKIKQSAAYWWPVRFTTPSAARAGEHDEHEIEVQFKRLDTEQHKALEKEVSEQKLMDPDVVPRIVTGWRNVIDESDGEVPFTPEALAELLRTPGVATAIIGAYFDSRYEAARKNSSTSPSPGPAAT
jgi:hypothetical protein